MYIYYRVFLFIKTYKFYTNKTTAIDIDYW